MWFRKKAKMETQIKAEAARKTLRTASKEAGEVVDRANRKIRAQARAMHDDNIIILIKKAAING